MANVLLVNPVIRQEDSPQHVPFGLAQLAAIISQAGHKVQLFDCNAWRPSEDQICSVLKADKWEVIGIGGLVTSYGYIKSFCQMAKSIVPSSLIVCGGGIITPIPRDIMTLIPQIDVGVIGEGYLTFTEVLSAVDNRIRSFKDILGIAWRDQEQIIINELRSPLKDLDQLPFPAWEMFPLEIYFKNSSLLLSEEAMNAKRRLDICCSYGCPYKCKYCFHLGLSGEMDIVLKNNQRDVFVSNRRKVRWHSPEYVVELVSHAKRKFGADFIGFLDENFMALDKFTKGSWMNSFERLWTKRDLQPDCIKEVRRHDSAVCNGIHWGATCHPAQADLSLLKRMHKIGCSHLDFGFESFSNKILKEAGKGSTKKLNLKALNNAQAAGIRAIPNQIIGFPNETFDSILESLDVWEEHGIKSYPFLATPYPGSEWFRTYYDSILEQYDGNLEDFLLELGDATKLTAVISHHFNHIEILGLRELMVNLDRKRILRYRDLKEQKNR